MFGLFNFNNKNKTKQYTKCKTFVMFEMCNFHVDYNNTKTKTNMLNVWMLYELQIQLTPQQLQSLQLQLQSKMAGQQLVVQSHQQDPTVQFSQAQVQYTTTLTYFYLLTLCSLKVISLTLMYSLTSESESYFSIILSLG